MTSFNVHIDHNGDNLTLTIIPKEDYFKIVYFGGILGALRKQGTDWILMEESEIDPGELAPFDYKLTPDGVHISLDSHEINQISEQIEHYLESNPD
ncbi:hypothetical protein DU508_11050 [Pedobacter chinensis]|uniref:Uncharacterized protein n=2 Tax=Pedobacter chinensis TaxID=2282421 RepID=A0A369PZM3_9SPHI|nr:hypothetical protein DU508_11050 [Pedobacter chinensis]